MGLFKKKPTLDELEEKRERVKVETEIATGEAAIAERKAVIKQLEHQYGSSWTKILGVSKLTDLSTLKSFLVGSKQGMRKATVSDATRKRLWGSFGE